MKAEPAILTVVITLVILIAGFSEAAQNACKSNDKGTCYCERTDGSGTIDMKILVDQSKKTPFATKNIDQKNYAAVFCGVIPSEDLDHCYNVASMCEFSDSGNFDLGDPASTRFEMRTSDKHTTPSVAIVMDGMPGDDGKTRRTVGFLNCQAGLQNLQWSSYGYQNSNDGDGALLYFMDFTHDIFCLTGPVTPPNNPSGGLSVGSVMCIIFFSLLFAYFVGGFLVLTFGLKKEGRERVPNSTFWIDLPSLAKEGFFFTWNKFKDLIGRR